MDKQAWLKIFGQELRYMMDMRGHTTRSLAKATGLNHTSIGRYTLGKEAPNLYSALKLAKALDCPLDVFACADYFMEDSDERE